MLKWSNNIKIINFKSKNLNVLRTGKTCFQRVPNMPRNTKGNYGNEKQQPSTIKKRENCRQSKSNHRMRFCSQRGGLVALRWSPPSPLKDCEADDFALFTCVCVCVCVCITILLFLMLIFPSSSSSYSSSSASASASRLWCIYQL